MKLKNHLPIRKWMLAKGVGIGICLGLVATPSLTSSAQPTPPRKASVVPNLAKVAEEEALRVVSDRMPGAVAAERRLVYSPDGAPMAQEITFRRSSDGTAWTVLTATRAEDPPLILMHAGGSWLGDLTAGKKKLTGIPGYPGEPRYTRTIYLGTFDFLQEFVVGNETLYYDPLRKTVGRGLTWKTAQPAVRPNSPQAERKRRVERQWSESTERYLAKQRGVK